jgi:hypothetical protein
MPLVAQLGQQRGVGGEAQHRQDVGPQQEINRGQSPISGDAKLKEIGL